MKRLLIMIIFLAMAVSASAQTTTVTGVVVDPNGNAYFPGTVSAAIILNSGQPIPAGVPASGSIGPFAMTSGGNFSVTVASPFTWTFTICGTPVSVGPRANPTPTQVCFSTLPIAISGASQVITSNLGTIPNLGPNVNSIPGNAATATALQNAPAQCGVNSLATGITVNGAANCTNSPAVTNLTVSGTQTVGNFNNIRIVDGVKFTQNAAGINAADADLVAGTAGEIWVPSGANINATDAQISIGNAHTLRNFGTISIDPVGKGPILLGKYSKLACAAQGGNSALGSIIDANSTAATNMIRARVQDGSLETFFVEFCTIGGGGASFTRGVIDATGMNDKGQIVSNIIFQYNGGPGLYIDDLNVGSNLGSCCSYFGHNWFLPAGASGNPNCITIAHGNTNSAILQNYEFQDNECAASALTTTTAGFRIVNSFAGAGVLRSILIESLHCSAYPNTCLDINGGQDVTVTHIICQGGSSTCVQIDNTTNNQAINLWSVFNSGSGSTIVDSVNSRTLTNVMVNHYPFINTNALTQSVEYLGSVFVASGNVKPVAHMVVDTVTLSGGSATITLSGAAAFTSSTTYDCDAHDATSGANMAVVKASGSSFTISAGTGTDPATFKCIGN